MVNISSIRNAYSGIQSGYNTVKASNQATGPPAVSPEDREGELSKQLDARLKAQLARIREQVDHNNQPASSAEEGHTLDICV